MATLTGEIESFEDFDAANDDEAILHALREAGEPRIELWRGGDKIVAISGANEPVELTIAQPGDRG